MLHNVMSKKVLFFIVIFCQTINLISEIINLGSIKDILLHIIIRFFTFIDLIELVITTIFMKLVVTKNMISNEHTHKNIILFIKEQYFIYLINNLLNIIIKILLFITSQNHSFFTYMWLLQSIMLFLITVALFIYLLIK